MNALALNDSLFRGRQLKVRALTGARPCEAAAADSGACLLMCISGRLCVVVRIGDTQAHQRARDAATARLFPAAGIPWRSGPPRLRPVLREAAVPGLARPRSLCTVLGGRASGPEKGAGAGECGMRMRTMMRARGLLLGACRNAACITVGSPLHLLWFIGTDKYVERSGETKTTQLVPHPASTPTPRPRRTPTLTAHHHNHSSSNHKTKNNAQTQTNTGENPYFQTQQPVLQRDPAARREGPQSSARALILPIDRHHHTHTPTYRPTHLLTGPGSE